MNPCFSTHEGRLVEAISSGRGRSSAAGVCRPGVYLSATCAPCIQNSGCASISLALYIARVVLRNCVVINHPGHPPTAMTGCHGHGSSAYSSRQRAVSLQEFSALDGAIILHHVTWLKVIVSCSVRYTA